MLNNYYPFSYVEDVFSINYEQLYNKGFRGLIFDIDNTLVPHGKESVKEIDDLFVKIHQIGFKTLLLSNNNESRILCFCKNIETLYIAEANKPSPSAFIRAMSMLGTHKENTIMIGDTTFTDILGANKAGIPSILVKYIGYYKKEWKGFKRYLEKMILLTYGLSRYNNRLQI